MKNRILRWLALLVALMFACSAGWAEVPAEEQRTEQEQRAEALVREADPDVRQCYTYPDGDATWVFGAYGTDETALFSGRFWHVSGEECVPTGDAVDRVFSWELIGSVEPRILTVARRIDGIQRAYAVCWKDGAIRPVEVGSLSVIQELDKRVGYFCGCDGENWYDYAFFDFSDGELRVIGGAPLDMDAAMRVPGFAEQRAEWEAALPEGTSTDALTYWPSHAGDWDEPVGSVKGVIGVDLTRAGAPEHLYVYLDEDGVRGYGRGWAGEPATLPGHVSASREVGLTVIPAGDPIVP